MINREGLFSKQLPSLQLVWDSTSYKLLQTCPRKYQLAMLEGWDSPVMAVPLQFGIWVHAGLAKYDTARAKGESHEAAQRGMVRWALEQTTKRGITIFCKEGQNGVGGCGWSTPKELCFYESCPICGCTQLGEKEGTAFWQGDGKDRTRFTLVRTLVWYTERYQQDPLATYVQADGTPALELSFRFVLGKSGTEEDLLWAGHLDKVVCLDGQFYVLERKHTKYGLNEQYFSQFSPDPQISGYTVGGEVIASVQMSGVIVDAAQVSGGYSRFRRLPIPRTRSQSDEFIENVKARIKDAERYARDNYWPMNDTACHYYGGCPFRGVCNKSPEVRAQYLQGDFVKRYWNPLETRT